MKNKLGFTLIELLVIILIIGVLAGVAIPQYRKAALKSQFATIKAQARAIYDAERRYRTENGQFTNDLTALDISGTSNCSVTPSSYAYCNLSYSNNMLLQYVISWEYAGKIRHRCDAHPANVNNLTNKICQLDTGKTIPDSCNETLYCRYYY